MGLGKRREKGVFLSIAGGFIWNRKADSSDPDYAEQTYVKADKSEGVRTGAQYADLTGMITGVKFRTHPEWGENINVTLEDGGDVFIVSISTNNRYSQDMMKFLLKADFSKPVFMKPYDFTDAKTKKRVQGISFRQDGEKISLRNDDAPSHEPEWFKEAGKKQIKRYFEDLTDWFVAEVEEKVCSQFYENTDSAEDGNDKEETGKSKDAESEEKGKNVEETSKESPKKETEKVTPLKMKKKLKEYLADNYEGKELPKLSKSELVEWYNLAMEDEELPFVEDDENEVSESDVDAQLKALMKGG